MAFCRGPWQASPEGGGNNKGNEEGSDSEQDTECHDCERTGEHHAALLCGVLESLVPCDRCEWRERFAAQKRVQCCADKHEHEQDAQARHDVPALRARDLLERAEMLAGLEPVKGGDFHPFRRKWVSERKHLPSRDVAAAGGWRDLRTMERSYQQADEHTLLAVVTEPAKLRDAERA